MQVENTIIRGNQSGGVRRFMVQGVVRRALRDIHHQRIPPRRSNGHHQCRSPAPQSTRGPVLPIRGTGMAAQPPATPSMSFPPTNRSGGAMPARHGAPPFPNRDADAERWPPGFAYDISVVPPPPPLHLLSRSLSDVVSHGRHDLPSGSALGAGFVSSEEGMFPRL
ncbi:hypothetical protein PVAP13_7NG109690 [Panicum virgatum]|uniref:Uncharacterized protein n=1 Tax=Panicum virgatum TaxID=38727 RepID=A0A8T0PVG2_PANVG|nr:hypothetical protein PVAP13_7NG109690 [Panicum virgatum]